LVWTFFWQHKEKGKEARRGSLVVNNNINNNEKKEKKSDQRKQLPQAQP